MFFLAESYFLSYILIFEIKKKMTVLVDENHDKWPNVTDTSLKKFSGALTTEIL